MEDFNMDDLIDLFGDYFDECEFSDAEVEQCIREFAESSREDQGDFISYMVTVVTFDETFEELYEEFLGLWGRTIREEFDKCGQFNAMVPTNGIVLNQLFYKGLGPKCIYVHFSLDLLVKPLYNGIYDRE